MKYRTKLTLVLMLLALTSNFIGASILYVRARKLIYLEIQSKILSIVASAAVFIDTDQILAFRSNPVEDSLAYRSLREQLIRTLNANKRKDLFSSFLYIFQKNDDEVIVEVDTKSAQEREEAGHSLIRSQKAIPPSQLRKVGEYEVSNLYDNPFGRWLSAFAPIRDAQGNIVAYLGINIRSSYIMNYLNKLLFYCLIVLAFSLIAAFILSFILSRTISRPLSLICQMVESIGSENRPATCPYQEKDEFGELASAIHQMGQGLEERERLKSNFSRYVSKEMLDIILKMEDKTLFEGERKKVTVLFSDLRQFSTLAETLPPEEVVLLLNEYFDQMISIIFKYQGTLDKILGDGMMVLFGAPIEDKDQETHAIHAAVEMQIKMQELCKKWEQENKKPVNMGIGIHTGEAIIGNIGSEKHLEYTAIGSTVNFAYKIEQSTKQHQTPILISKTTLSEIQNNFNVISKGNLFIKDKDTKLELFALQDLGKI